MSKTPGSHCRCSEYHMVGWGGTDKPRVGEATNWDKKILALLAGMLLPILPGTKRWNIQWIFSIWEQPTILLKQSNIKSKRWQPFHQDKTLEALSFILIWSGPPSDWLLTFLTGWQKLNNLSKITELTLIWWTGNGW